MANRWRLRPRFSLWAMLVVVTVAAIPLAYLGYLRRFNERRKAAHDDLTSKGITLRQSSSQPLPPTPNVDESSARKFWATVLGNPDLPKFDHVNIHDFYGKNRPRPPISNEDLARLAHLPEIESLNFYHSTIVTDEGLSVLGKLPKLKRIQIQDLRQVTGAFLDSMPDDCPLESLRILECEALSGRALKSLGRLKNLNQLSIDHAPLLTDESLREVDLGGGITELHLNYLPLGDETLTRWLPQVQLTDLEIQLPITRRVVPFFDSLTHCTSLCISNAPLIDEDFAFLKNCSRLKGLKLTGMPIRGDFLDHLPKPEQLEALSLSNSLFSDSQLPTLAKHPNLKILDLAWTPLTGEGFKAEVDWPRPWHIELCGTRFSDSGKDALAKLKSLQTVFLPSNWTLDDNQRFPAEWTPTRPNYNAHLTLGGDGKLAAPSYMPSLNLGKINHCPVDVMKPVADLQALGLAEDEAWRKREEAAKP